MVAKKKQKANKARANRTRTNAKPSVTDLVAQKSKTTVPRLTNLVMTNPVMKELADVAEGTGEQNLKIEYDVAEKLEVSLSNLENDEKNAEIIDEMAEGGDDESTREGAGGETDQVEAESEAAKIEKEVEKKAEDKGKKTLEERMTRLTFRVERDLKEQAEELFRSMGMTTTAALNMFLVQAVREQRLPFQPSLREVEEYEEEPGAILAEEEGDPIEQLEMSLEEAEALVNGKKEEKGKYDDLEALIRGL